MKSSNNELHSLMVDQLRDILWAEKHLLKALPKMAKAAKEEKLSTAFSTHAKETEQQIERLKQIFDKLGLAARAKKCDAMEGLLSEAHELEDDYSDSQALDAALICAAQKVEHYEIATYGSLHAYAKRLGHSEVADLLGQTLQEEEKTDKLLTEISNIANENAVA